MRKCASRVSLLKTPIFQENIALLLRKVWDVSAEFWLKNHIFWCLCEIHRVFGMFLVFWSINKRKTCLHRCREGLSAEFLRLLRLFGQQNFARVLPPYIDVGSFFRFFWKNFAKAQKKRKNRPYWLYIFLTKYSKNAHFS